MEKQFIEQLKKGNEPAFKKFVESWQTRVFNTCYGFLHNRQDADDVAQEVFIEVFQSIASFNFKSSLNTWVYRIAVNKSLDFIRKSKRKKRWSELTRISINEKETDDNWFVDNQSPEAQLEQKERIASLNKAVEKLPANQKAAFTLHKYEELSYKEISEILETSLSSVESLMHRAKKNLRKHLEKYYREEKG